MSSPFVVSVFLFGVGAALFMVFLRDWIVTRLRIRRAKQAARHERDGLADAYRAVLAGQAAAFMADDPLAAAYQASAVLRACLQTRGKRSAAMSVARAATRLEAIELPGSSSSECMRGFSPLELAALLLTALARVAADLRAAGRRHGAVFVGLAVAMPIRWYVLDAIEYGALLDPTRPEHRALNPMAAMVDGDHPCHRLEE